MDRLKKFGTVEFKGVKYQLLEEARDMYYSDSAEFVALAVRADDSIDGQKYLIHWDIDNPDTEELSDTVTDWYTASDVEEWND